METRPGFALEGRALHRRHWLLVAGEAQGIGPFQEAVSRLARGGHKVTYAHLDGPQAALGPLVRGRRVSFAADLPRGIRHAAKVVERPLPRAMRLRLAAGRDSWLAAAVARADHVLLVDDIASRLIGPLRSHNPSARYWEAGEVPNVLEEELWWRYLDRRLHQLSANLDKPLRTRNLVEATAWLRGRGPGLFPPPEDVHRVASGMIHALARRGRPQQARALLQLCRLVEDVVPAGAEASVMDALEVHLRLSDDAVDPWSLTELLDDVFQSADAALRSGSLALAASRAAIGLSLMFHPRLHIDVPKTPLVEDPTGFTGPLHRSRVGQMLTSPSRRAPQSTSTAQSTSAPRPTSDAPIKVTFLPGAYPWHAKRALAALEADPRVELSVLKLNQARFRSMNVGPSFIAYRMDRARRKASEVQSPAHDRQLAALDESDVVIADWADKGAVWASMELPVTARMVVRIHSADVLSAAIHLVDWSRVDDVICVSEHLRRIFIALLGQRAAQVRLHVVPNMLDQLPSGGDASAADGRTIAMVGWARKVKDPLMALEILAGLLAREPGWRLRLIGSDFEQSSSGLLNRYHEAFRRRAAEPDLVGSVEFVGHTQDVLTALAGTAFILSTSLRESFHIGAMEGIAAGAVPIIRDWPAYAKYNGAASLFPPWSIFETPEEAVGMIWSLRDPADRLGVLSKTQESMRAVLDAEDASSQLLDIILSQRPGSSATPSQ